MEANQGIFYSLRHATTIEWRKSPKPGDVFYVKGEPIGRVYLEVMGPIVELPENDEEPKVVAVVAKAMGSDGTVTARYGIDACFFVKKASSAQ